MARDPDVRPEQPDDGSREQQVMNRRIAQVEVEQYLRESWLDRTMVLLRVFCLQQKCGDLGLLRHFPLEGSPRPARVRGEIPWGSLSEPSLSEPELEVTVIAWWQLRHQQQLWGGKEMVEHLGQMICHPDRPWKREAPDRARRRAWHASNHNRHHHHQQPQPPQHEGTQLLRAPLRLRQPLQQNGSTNRLPPPLHQAVQ